MCSAAIAQEDDAESTTANSSDDGDTTSTLSSSTDGDAGRDWALKGTVSRDELNFTFEIDFRQQKKMVLDTPSKQS